MKLTPALISILAGIGAAALGRWFGFAWPISVLVGIGVWLIITGFTARRP